MLEKNDSMWDTLIAEQPQLSLLLGIAESYSKRSRNFCANRIFQRLLKPFIYKMVGWGAPKESSELMRSSEAYMIASNKIFSALPNCKNCGCL